MHFFFRVEISHEFVSAQRRLYLWSLCETHGLQDEIDEVIVFPFCLTFCGLLIDSSYEAIEISFMDSLLTQHSAKLRWDVAVSNRPLSKFGSDCQAEGESDR